MSPKSKSCSCFCSNLPYKKKRKNEIILELVHIYNEGIFNIYTLSLKKINHKKLF